MFVGCIASLAYGAEYGQYKLGKEYYIGSALYKPREVESLTQEGYASWYGAEFHNKSTANGAIFDKNLYTAAHRTLPMPSVIEVENLENGKKIVAVVNDRGPFTSNDSRILDLSEQSANELGFIEAGTAYVRIKYLASETEKLRNGSFVKTGSTSGLIINSNVGKSWPIYITVGNFFSFDNAMAVHDALCEKGCVIESIKSDEFEYYSIKIGFDDESYAQDALDDLHKIGYSSATIG